MDFFGRTPHFARVKLTDGKIMVSPFYLDRDLAFFHTGEWRQVPSRQIRRIGKELYLDSQGKTALLLASNETARKICDIAFGDRKGF